MSDPIAEKTRETFTQRALEAFKKVPNNRHYALDFKSENEVGAVLLAYRDITLENGGGFDMVELTKVFETLSQDLPGLVQDRPDPEQEIPKLPVDETTGEQALNPWKKGSENLSDQMLVEQRDPKLAAHLKAIANGVSYSLLYKQRDERERREKLRQLRYTGAEHKQNPFHLSGKEGLKAQSAFVKQHEHEPWLIEFYKREASEPVTLNFNNLSMRMKVTKKDPILGKIFERAIDIHKQWLRDDIERLSQLTGESAAQIEAARKQLATAR